MSFMLKFAFKFLFYRPLEDIKGSIRWVCSIQILV